MHKALGMKLLYSTAYHLQTNSTSKQTNQTAEIVLQFYLHTIDGLENWPKILPQIQSLINNSESLCMTKTPNKITLGFTPNQPLDLLAGSIRLDYKVA